MDEYEKAVRNLRREHVDNLILDLTGNGGGYLNVAIDLADQFIENNRLIVYTQGINSGKNEYYATKSGNFEKGNLVILIDEGSASASEILSGAIQDWDRGIIVGRRSFGKGLVQKPLLLPDQSMIRLTIARYYTPSGRLIQKPYDMGRDDYNMEIAQRFEHGEFAHADSIHLADSLKFYTLENTRTVYGGGGIMPDYFVSIDTSYYTDYYSQLVNNETIARFALEYVDWHRQALQQMYPDFTLYKNGFAISEEIHRQLVNYAWNDGIAENTSEYAVSKDRIELLLKAHIARDLWSSSEFYEVLNQGDEKFQTAVMILKNWDNYEASLLKKK
jgi:carboxyl-terminal processing protease